MYPVRIDYFVCTLYVLQSCNSYEVQEKMNDPAFVWHGCQSFCLIHHIKIENQCMFLMFCNRRKNPQKISILILLENTKVLKIGIFWDFP